MYSWDLLPNFLQSIFPSNYSYIIQCITKLPPYRTEEGFEIDQFKIDVFVNVATAESAEIWFSAFEKHSKMTLPQTKGYEIKGKRVIFRQLWHCIHSQKVRKKQGDFKVKLKQLIRNRNTGCSATLHLRLERRNISTSHPLEVNLAFTHNHFINSAELLSFRHIREETRKKFIQMFYDGHSAPSFGFIK